MSATATRTRTGRRVKRLPRTRNGNIPQPQTAKITDYWIERLRTPAGELGFDSQDCASMSFREDDLRHYAWWTLAKGIRSASGRTRLVLVNGDQVSNGGMGPSTASRTQDAERAARKAGLTVLNVPFSALDAAGIEHGSIRVLEGLRESYSVTLAPVSAAEVERDLTGNYPLYRAHDDGTVSVRDERQDWSADARWILERDGESYLVPRFRHWLGEAVFSAKVRGRARRAKFLSAFDHNEGWCYFLCELPPTRARTVAEAFEALAPAEVKRAQEAGLDVRRQGDIFAIPTSLTTRELKARAVDRTIKRYEQTRVELVTTGRRYSRETGQYEVVELDTPYERPFWDHVPYQVKSLRMSELLGTTHIATEQILTTDGDTYARGFLRHRPANRRPDHRQVKLGDGRTWYRILRNTVPLARGFTGTITRAWTLGGRVD